MVRLLRIRVVVEMQRWVDLQFVKATFRTVQHRHWPAHT